MLSAPRDASPEPRVSCNHVLTVPNIVKHFSVNGPLGQKLPFTRLVYDSLADHQLLVITPCTDDLLDFGRILNDKIRFTEPAATFNRCYRTTLNISNRLVHCHKKGKKVAQWHLDHGAEEKLSKLFARIQLETKKTELALAYEYLDHTRYRSLLTAQISTVLPRFKDRPYYQNMEYDDIAANRTKSSTSKVTYFASEAERPLQLDSFASDKLSLLSLKGITDIEFSGVNTASIFFKEGFAHFNAHTEQMGFSFYHHQLRGESVWIIIEPQYTDRVIALIAMLLHENRAANPDLPQRDSPLPVESLILFARISFAAKDYLFYPKLLEENDIPFQEVTITGERILIGWGTLIHCGIGGHKHDNRETLAYACNFVSYDWMRPRSDSQGDAAAPLLTEVLKQGSQCLPPRLPALTLEFKCNGPDFVRRHFELIHQLQCFKVRLTADAIVAPSDSGSTSSELLLAALKEVGLSEHELHAAMNMCPPRYACLFLTSLKSKYDDSDGTKASNIERDSIYRALEAMHQTTVRDFLTNHYAGESHLICSAANCTFNSK